MVYRTPSLGAKTASDNMLIEIILEPSNNYAQVTWLMINYFASVGQWSLTQWCSINLSGFRCYLQPMGDILVAGFMTPWFV